MSRATVRVAPAAIVWSVSADFLNDPIDHDRLRVVPRHLFVETTKCRSIRQRYLEGRPWEDTPLFRQSYADRFARGESVRGCTTIKALLEQYYSRVDGMFADLRMHGFRLGTPAITVYVGHDGAVLLGNQGNHRVSMAQIIGMKSIPVDVMGRHPESDSPRVARDPDVPALPESAQAIPAMTTEAERQAYYRLTRACAVHGAVVELGAWLGASTAYIAAGIRDAGVSTKAHVYDRFVWKPASHDRKAGGPLGMPPVEAFRRNLGPLMAFVDVHPGELNHLVWSGGPVAVLVCDAPKRIQEISHVLTAFHDALTPGALMVWQDFAYFPSYDIPAALTRLAGHVEFVEAVYPGTTAVFRVTKPWRHSDVSTSALALTRWTADEVEAAWTSWGERLPAQMRPRFACGAAMFLCDLGAVERARRWLAAVIEAHAAEVVPKWRYLIAERETLMKRYQPLVEVLARCA